MGSLKLLELLLEQTSDCYGHGSIGHKAWGLLKVDIRLAREGSMLLSLAKMMCWKLICMGDLAFATVASSILSRPIRD
jgi:hypothetical protein